MTASVLAARELSAADLKLPFRLSPEEEHPFLTLKDYFSALEQFVAADTDQIDAALN